MFLEQFLIRMPFFPRFDQNLRAGQGIRRGIMVFQWNLQMMRHIRQLGWKYAPGCSGQFHGAEKGGGHWLVTGHVAAGP